MTRLLVTALALAVAGCGGSGSGGSGDARDSEPARDAIDVSELDGCTLVTTDEVSSALGSPVGQGESRGLAGCGWRAESGAALVLQVYAGSHLTEGTCDAQKFFVSGTEQEVPGLGDSALWGSSGDLVVCSERAVLKIDVDDTPNDPDQDRDAAIAVARLVLGRL